RNITLELGKQCTKVDDSGSELTVHFGDGETLQADLMLLAVGRGPSVEGLGLEGIGVELDKRKGIAADEHRRTTVPHIYAVGDCAGYWQLAHTAFREGEVAAENACGHDAIVDNRAVPRPIYTDPEIAGVGLTEAEAREQYGDDVATGMFPWVANARAVMQNDTVAHVKALGARFSDRRRLYRQDVPSSHPWGHAARGPQGFSPRKRRLAQRRRFHLFVAGQARQPGGSLAETKGAAMGIVNRRN